MGFSFLKVCWEVAHRAACLDAPENSLEAVRSVIVILIVVVIVRCVFLAKYETGLEFYQVGRSQWRQMG